MLPVGTQSGSNADFLFREVYRQAMPWSVAVGCPAWGMLREMAQVEDGGGLNFNFNVKTELSGAAGFGGPNYLKSSGAAQPNQGISYFPMPREGKQGKGTASYKEYQAQGVITQNSINRAKKSGAAAMDVEAEVDTEAAFGMAKTIERALFRNVYSSGTVTGVLGVVLADATAATTMTMTVNVDLGHCRQFYAGMQLAWGTALQLTDTTSILQQTGRLISYTVDSAGVVSLVVASPNATNIDATAGHLIVVGDNAQGATYTAFDVNPWNGYNREITSFREMALDSGTLFGLDPTVHLSWKGVADTSTSRRALTATALKRWMTKFSQLNQAPKDGASSFAEAGNIEKGAPSCLFMSDYLLPDFEAALPGITLQQPLDPEMGLDETRLTFNVNGKPIKIVTSPRHPPDEITAVDFKAVNRVVLAEIAEVSTPDGQTYQTLPGSPTTYFKAWMGQGEVICTRRRGIGYFADIDVDWTKVALED